MFSQANLDIPTGQNGASFIGPPPGYIADIFNPAESLPPADYSTPGLYVTPGPIEVLDDCPGFACSELVSGVESLKVTAATTPEPGTFSLMLLGIGSLGLMVVMRKRIAQGLPPAT
jgi:hypothetical protein